MQKKSIIYPSDLDMFEGAISEEDFIATYTDTVTDGISSDFFNNRPHIPIGIEITQRSYAWSYEYAENFVLFDFQVKNIKQVPIRELYIGIFIDGDVGAEPSSRYDDDLCGFAPSFVDTQLNCEFVDVTILACIADNDGDFD